MKIQRNVKKYNCEECFHYYVKSKYVGAIWKEEGEIDYKGFCVLLSFYGFFGSGTLEELEAILDEIISKG